MPESGEFVCIAKGATVTVAEGEGTDEAGAVEGEGALVISGGTLLVSGTMLEEPSNLATLTQEGGRLTGAGTLRVSKSLTWSGGEMSGKGATVVNATASGTLNPYHSGAVHLTGGRTLVNEKTTVLSPGHLALTEGSVLKNTGTFEANSTDCCYLIGYSSTTGVIKNTGLFEHTEGAGEQVEARIENEGVVKVTTGKMSFTQGGTSRGASEWIASEGAQLEFLEHTFSLSGGSLSGTIGILGAAVTMAGNVEAGNASITVGPESRSSLSVAAGSTTTVRNLVLMYGAELEGPGTLGISASLDWSEGNMVGEGTTRLEPGASGVITGTVHVSGEHRVLVNEGTLTLSEGRLSLPDGGTFRNTGTFKANSSSEPNIGTYGPPPGLVVNSGLFEKTEGSGTATIEPCFTNLGLVRAVTGKFQFDCLHRTAEASNRWGPPGKPSTPNTPQATCGEDPVNCATGNYFNSETDFAIGGRGVGLDLTRTYNSQAAAAGIKSPFGYGWSSSFSDHLKFETGQATLTQADGSTVTFAKVGESYVAPAWTQDTLGGSEASGYTLTYPSQTKYHFNGVNGRLESVTDRHGNETTLSYEGERLKTITDPAKRQITLEYNAGGFVKSATDPMHHTVKYEYEGENLISVTQPGELALRWQFKYEGHELKELIDGRGNKTINEYYADQLIWQIDPEHRKLTFEYETFHTKITAESTEPSETRKSVTDEYFNVAYLPVLITHGYGTSEPKTESFAYDEADNLLSFTDGNNHTTKYTYENGDRTSETNPDGDETKWKYNTTHDVIATTTPRGETTNIERNEENGPHNGDAEVVERPAPEGTQKTTYTYGEYGELKTATEHLEHSERTWEYKYDSYGDLNAEIDPEKDERTWTYNEDSQEETTTSPRGNAPGAEPAKFKTTIGRDAQGRPLTVTEPTSEPGQRAFISDFTVPYDVEGSFKEPEQLAVDSSGNIWVADSGHNHVLEFNSKQEYLRQFGSKGTGPGQFERIRGIAVNKAGDVYVTDYANDRVQEFSPTGGYIRKFGSLGTKEGQFVEPTGIAVDSSGNVWVLSTYGQLVQEFSPTGEVIKSLRTLKLGTGPGELEGQAALAFSGENLYISEWGNQRVQEFSTSGTSLHIFDEAGSGTGKSKLPWGIASDPTTGNLYVSEVGNDRVQEFTASGAFVVAFGEPGSGAGQFAGPRGVAVTPIGNILVADTNHNRVQEWTAGKPPTYTTSFVPPENIEGSLKEPEELAVDSSGNIWVADSGHDRVLEFNSKREYQRQFGSEGTKEGQFEGIRGIAVNKAGDVYVSDYANDRVQEFSSTGTWLRQFGSPGTEKGQFVEPTAIAIDSSGNVWVLSTYGVMVQEFTPEGSDESEGKYLPAFGSLGTGSGHLSGPSGLAISGGNLYVSEWGNQRVQEFSTSGTPLHIFDEAGSGPGKSKLPWGIASDPTTGNLYVSEIGNDRVQEFRASGEFVAAFGSAGAGAGQLAGPRGLGVGTSENVLIADTANGRIQEWQVSHPRVTSYTYDPDGNLKTVTDPDGHTTTYEYNADNEPIKVTAPNGAVTETGYDDTGQVISQTDGDNYTTRYERNAAGEIKEVIDPLGRKTVKKYDPAGNLEELTDPLGRNTHYQYYPDNQLKEVEYQGETPSVKYEYDADGNRTKTIDSTGETAYTYDKLDRLEEQTHKHGETTESTKYKYDLANEQKEITYPNGKAVTREYDKAGRLESVTDWMGNKTTFKYDPDADLSKTIFPASTGDVDENTYSYADQMSTVNMTKASTTLASLSYARDSDGQVANVASTGLPGKEATGYEYDEDSRLTQAGTNAYGYDNANSPTTTLGSTNTYDAASELRSGTGVEYSYNELGERLQSKPETGPATTYGYNQAGDLISVKRPEEGSTPKIEDSYAYNGESLRTSQTSSGTTSQLTWDVTEELPVLLSDGTNSYIYGPSEVPIEQVSSGGTVTYLHHDQQGSTRLLTGSTGAVEGKCSYGAYGSPSCEGAATSPLGFDSEYTNSDTGLQYLRARNYDPSTGQFTSGDPLKAFTGAPYSFAKDNPLRYGDASGLCNAEFWTESFWTEGNCVSESPLNPIPYYEAEVRSAEAGCGYFASVRLGLEGALAGAALFAGGEGADEAGLAAETLSNPELVSRLSPEEIDQLAREAGYEIGPGGAGYSNPATRYYVPGTNRSEGFRVLSEGVKGQSGLKGGPYLRYFGGPNHGVGVPLGGG